MEEEEEEKTTTRRGEEEVNVLDCKSTRLVFSFFVVLTFKIYTHLLLIKIKYILYFLLILDFNLYFIFKTKRIN